MKRMLPRELDDLGGMRVARWFRESTAGQWDNSGPDAQREQQDLFGDVGRYRHLSTDVRGLPGRQAGRPPAAAWQATMAGLDAEQQVAHQPRQQQRMAPDEVVAYLRSLPNRWDHAGPEGRQALATALFTKLQVEGHTKMRYQLTPDAVTSADGRGRAKITSRPSPASSPPYPRSSSVNESSIVTASASRTASLSPSSSDGHQHSSTY